MSSPPAGNVMGVDLDKRTLTSAGDHPPGLSAVAGAAGAPPRNSRTARPESAANIAPAHQNAVV